MRNAVRQFSLLTILALAFIQTGCAMCCGTYDEAYAGYGGLYERSDLFHGRVASPFSDPNAAYVYSDSDVEMLDEPELEPIQ